MKLILRLLLLSLGLSLWLVGSASAQTGCSTLTLSSLLALFNDNVPPGSITPADIRDLICSVPTLAGTPQGLGTLAFQNANNVNITGGTISGVSLLNGTLTGPTLTNVTITGGTISGIIAPFAVSDNKVSPIVVDGFAISGTSQSGTNSQAIYNQAVFSNNPTLFQSYDSLRGIAIAPPNSTVNTITGVAGYTVNNTVPIGQRSQTAGLFGVAVCVVNNADCWGVDTIASDNPLLSNTGVTTGTGKFLYNEFDLNVTSPNTSGANLQVGGTALPTNVTLNIQGLAVNKLWGAGGQGTGTALYSNGVIVADACCATGMLVGVNALSGNAVSSMPLTFNYRDSSGNVQNMTLGAFGPTTPAQGVIVVGGSAGNSLAALTGLAAGGAGAVMKAGNIAMAKESNTPTAPGAGFLKLEVAAGTNGGTCKLIAYAGTSATPTTILDNIGAGC